MAEPTLVALGDAMCDLAMSYSDPALQAELEAARRSGSVHTIALMRELLLPHQAPVLRRCGFPGDSDGLVMLEAALLRHAREGHMELLRMANAALQLIKIPPLPCKVKDPLRSEPLEVLRHNADRRDFWRSLCPWLHVDDAKREVTGRNPVFPCGEDSELGKQVATLSKDLVQDGYFTIDGGVLPWAVNIAGVAAGIVRLMALGLPPLCILAYDEPWIMASQLEQLIDTTTGGGRLIFDWSAFCVKAVYRNGGDYMPVGKESWRIKVDPNIGWAPHRTRGSDVNQSIGLRADGIPEYATFWVPLTDATPENSCLMVVPRMHDPDYDEDSKASPLSAIFHKLADFQRIRAVPVAAGGLIALSHRICHWDSVADPRASAPRVAIAIAAANPGYEKSCFSKPLQPSSSGEFLAPQLGVRLALASAQIMRYADKDTVVTNLSSLAVFWELFEKHAEDFCPDFRHLIGHCKSRQHENLTNQSSENNITSATETRSLRCNMEDSIFETSVDDSLEESQETCGDSPSRELPVKLDPFEVLDNSKNDPSFWRNLCPWLHLCDSGMAKAALKQLWPSCQTDKFALETADVLAEHMRQEGYFRIPGGQLPWAIDVAAVARGVIELVSQGLPPFFIFVYDEPWVMAAQTAEMIKVTTGGNQRAFDWSAFCVRASHHPRRHFGSRDKGQGRDGAAAAGWPPHRDRYTNESAKRGFRKDGSPRYTTIWIPLTDATPQSSCLMIMPRRRDPGYRHGDNTASEITYLFRSAADFQYIRAVPVAAGGLLAFNHRLFHWGSMADPRAPAPRVAIAFNATDPKFEAPCFKNPDSVLPLPSLQVRLALIAAQSMTYAGQDHVITSQSRLRMFWHMFDQGEAAFTRPFYDEVERYNIIKHDKFDEEGVLSSVK